MSKRCTPPSSTVDHESSWLFAQRIETICLSRDACEEYERAREQVIYTQVSALSNMDL